MLWGVTFIQNCPSGMNILNFPRSHLPSVGAGAGAGAGAGGGAGAGAGAGAGGTGLRNKSYDCNKKDAAMTNQFK